MAGWEEELAMLLRELGVAQEEPKTYLQPMRKRMRSDLRERATDASFWDGIARDAISSGDDDPSLNDLSLMRHEVETLVSQVIRLMQRGDLDRSSKEDVMIVLRALRRRASVTQQAAASDEAYLEFASAMLHFCRLILNLSESAIEDHD